MRPFTFSPLGMKCLKSGVYLTLTAISVQTLHTSTAACAWWLLDWAVQP